MFNIAQKASFKSETIIKAFKTTGLSPFNPQVILTRFNKKQTERPSLSESTGSVLSASDQRKIEQLLGRVVDDIYDRRVRQLGRTMQAVSVRNTLLKRENERLKEALTNEKKRRQHSKPLQLEAPLEYYGGAVFWSPKKVQEARDRRVQKNLEQEALQLQKHEKALRREAQKLEKACLQEQKKHQTAIVKEAQLQKAEATAT